MSTTPIDCSNRNVSPAASVIAKIGGSLTVELQRAFRDDYCARAAAHGKTFRPGGGASRERLFGPRLVEHRIAKIGDPWKARQTSERITDDMCRRNGIRGPNRRR